MQQFPFIDQLYMFRATVSPFLSSNLTVCTALVQCTDLLPTGDTAEMELPTVVPSQPAKTSPETCRADLRGSVNGNCCILLVA
jgi:hypothetical protein